MVAAIERIDFPELVIGFVAPIGTDLRASISANFGRARPKNFKRLS